MKRVFVLVLVAFCCGVAFQRSVGLDAAAKALGLRKPTPTSQFRPVPDEHHGRASLFVLAGQSNMAGYGNVREWDGKTSDSVLMLGNDYRWRVATEPVDTVAGQVDEVSADRYGGAGPSLAFGLAVWRASGHPVGLLPCAKGGSRIAEWTRSTSDSTLHGAMLKRCRAAAVMGDLSGLLFFQGESDAVAGDGTPWDESFARFVADVRSDTSPGLPIVFAQIGHPPSDIDPGPWEEIRRLQASVRLPGVAMIRTDDLPMGDRLHFTTASYAVIGERFAEAMETLLQKSSADVSEPAVQPPAIESP